MFLRVLISTIFIFSTCTYSLLSLAAVTTVEAGELGVNYTNMGAEKKGNHLDIPDWTGSMQGVPENLLAYRGAMQRKPNPYSADPFEYTVNIQNMLQYQAFLTPGLQALLKTYPNSFSIPVYRSHRDGRYSLKFERRTLWNARNTRLLEGSAGISNYTGGIPFPKAKNGREVMWNARLAQPNASLNGVLDSVAVYRNGKQQLAREIMVSEYPYANPKNKIGVTEAELGIFAGLLHIRVEEPTVSRGAMTIIQEPILDMEEARQAWVYLVGQRRVRRFPTLGFDAPYGPGGILTIDDLLGFNGSMERFTWKLLGKQEKIIPYHAYAFDSANVGYGRLLQTYHANPEFMRYEKHRVWIVEANLKAGLRHVYAKRRFYIDEDSWQIVLTENYDNQGRLWKVGILNTVYDFAVQGYIARVQMHHDLLSKAYVATRLINETAPPNLLAEPKGAEYYQPANLRKMGNR